VKGVKHTASSCSSPECARPPRKRGFCEMHYRRWQRHGDAGIVLNVRGLAAEDRFWSHVTKGDGCWLWEGQTITGYGRFKLPDGTHIMAHRFAYETTGAAIPDGLTIDHLCNVRACVNPSHLEPVTQGENNRRRGERRRNAAKAQAR
jgi:hypothetical protein